jgi:O-acetyl-ADP-ribose deacetylase (regulator of RNase III)
VTTSAPIQYIVGDALQPIGRGTKIVAHIVNDRAAQWGAGFGLAVAKKWPMVQSNFARWASHHPESFALGAFRLTPAKRGLIVAQMICQKGYGPSKRQRLQYDKLSCCLGSLAHYAKSLNASVHMPRIGTGWAGGSWSSVVQLINSRLTRLGILVYVYDLPRKR